MAYTLYRTAHSTFVKETEDFTIGLLTPTGKTFAIPLDLGATWFPGLDYEPALKMVADGYEEGDIAFTNDPYSGFVATHSPDLHMWKPIFHEGELVAFSCGHIHNTDIGGAVPASLSHPCRDSSRRHPLHTLQTLQTRRTQRRTAESHDDQCPTT